jgi:hypothetical protein
MQHLKGPGPDSYIAYVPLLLLARLDGSDTIRVYYLGTSFAESLHELSLKNPYP